MNKINKCTAYISVKGFKEKIGKGMGRKVWLNFKWGWWGRFH